MQMIGAIIRPFAVLIVLAAAMFRSNGRRHAAGHILGLNCSLQKTADVHSISGSVTTHQSKQWERLAMEKMKPTNVVY